MGLRWLQAGNALAPFVLWWLKFKIRQGKKGLVLAAQQSGEQKTKGAEFQQHVCTPVSWAAAHSHLALVVCEVRSPLTSATALGRHSSQTLRLHKSSQVFGFDFCSLRSSVDILISWVINISFQNFLPVETAIAGTLWDFYAHDISLC